jgi:hypothetical protein
MDPFFILTKTLYTKILSPPRINLSLSGSEYFGKWTIFTFFFISYFFVMSGVIYDMINEPPALGQVIDERTGKPKPQAVMMWRINGQYIFEGLTAGN